MIANLDSTLFNALLKKFKRRSQICTIMIQHSRCMGDESALEFWMSTLQSLQYLQTDGMSDEETEDRGGEKVRLVKDLHFRHPAFTDLWQYVDDLPRSMHSLFAQSGVKRLCRVFSHELTNRLPPKNLPCTFYRPEYLGLMKSGGVPYSPTGDDVLIPSPPISVD